MSEDRQSSKIEDIKRKLYDREDKNTRHFREGVLHSVQHNVANVWAKPESKDVDLPKHKSSFFKKFFIGAVIFFICAIGVASYMFLHSAGLVSNDNIDINVIGNAFTEGGSELPLQVEIVNRNSANLELSNLIIEYPRGASDNANDVIRLPRDSIGTITSGASVTRNVKVSLFGDQGNVRNVTVRLEYHPAGSNAIFTKEKQYPVTISSSPLSLLIDAPDTTNSNQEVTLKVSAMLNTTLPSDATMLKVDYPTGFTFVSAVPAPTIGNSLWSLSNLSQSAPVYITIIGKLIGQDGDQQAFHVSAGTTSTTNQSIVDVVYNSLLHIITIQKPFLDAKILVNGVDQENYVVSGGETVRADIAWTNNLSVQISDAQIIAHLSGNVFDKTNVDSIQGFYDSANNQIIWDKNSIPELGSIEPGGTGKVSFTFNPISLIGADKNLKDPQVLIDVSVKGKQPSIGAALADINNFTQKVVKILSDFQLATSAIYSTGSFPPKAEQETQYTVTWTLSNSANTITGAEARAALPIYVKFIGTAPSNIENISYNDVTREVIWKIGSVNPNTGFGTVNREASFIIGLSPSISQVGSAPQLMKNVDLLGMDSFAGSQIKSSSSSISTNLLNDPNFKPSYDIVVK